MGEVKVNTRGALEFTLPTLAVDPAFVFPTAVVASEEWATVYGLGINEYKAGMTSSWVEVFHWVNHMGPSVGSSYYALSSNAAVLAKMWQQGLAGNATIYYLPSSGGMREQYMVVARAVINGVQSNHPWVSILAGENGAPITSYSTALRHGAESAMEASKFLPKLVARGWVEITPDQLPAAIRDNWAVKTPSLIRIVLWAVSYQVKVAAASLGITLAEAATQLALLSRSLVTPGIVIFSDPCVFEFETAHACRME
jgi:hypothetical protein